MHYRAKFAADPKHHEYTAINLDNRRNTLLRRSRTLLTDPVSSLSYPIKRQRNQRIQMDFQLHTDYKPQGDQPAAIRELVSGLHAGEKDQTLLGVTGSG
jgi:hypothetical protein